MRGHAHKAAAQGIEGVTHPGQRARFEPNIVIKEQHFVRLGLLECKLAVFGKAAARQVTVQFDGGALGAQDPEQAARGGVLQAAGRPTGH